MRLLIVGLIVLALGAGTVTALLFKRVLDAQKAVQVEVAETVVEKVEKKSLVLVADVDITAGTVVARSLLRWQNWPKDDVRGEFASGTKEDSRLAKKFVGKIARHGIRAGTPITQKMVFDKKRPGFLTGVLDEGMRAVAVEVTAVSGAGGFILPGDFVDVILTFDVSRAANFSEEERTALKSVLLSRAAETVLRSVRVLAIGQKFDDLNDKAEVVKDVTLALNRQQAERLAVASTMGKITLALRSLSESKSEDKKESFTTDLQISPTLRSVFESVRRDAEKKSNEKPRPTKKSRTNKRKVRVIRGGEETTKEF